MTHPTILSDEELIALLKFGSSSVTLGRLVERAVIEKLGASEAVPCAHRTHDSRWFAGPPGKGLVYALGKGTPGRIELAYDATALAQARQQGYEEARAEFVEDAARWQQFLTGSAVRFSGKTERGKPWSVYLAQRDMNGWQEAFTKAIDAARQPTLKETT